MKKPKTILKLIKQGEGLNVEFKSSTSNLDRIGEIACSFANSKGGHILIGISDDKQISGIEIGRQTIERIADIIVDNSDPKIYPDVSSCKIDDKHIVVIKVVESRDKPHLYLGRAFIRVGKNTKPMSRNEYERLLLKRRPIVFDAQICEDASLKDIDEEKVKEFLEQRAIKLKVEIPRVSIKDILVKTIKVLRLVEGKLKPTNAGVLFFGKAPQDFIPQSEVKVARVKGATMTEFIDSAILKGSFYEILRNIEMFFWKNTRLASKIVEFKRVEIPEYPFEAIREAVVNAMAHRDYFRTGATISILIFDDRIEVQSPGGLLPHLNLKKLEGVHETRNNLICDIFHQTKDMEKYGTGIGKMKRWMKEHGLEQPILSTDSGFFKVTFYGPGDKILDLVPSIPKERTTDLSHLNERQVEALKLMINGNQEITNSEYRRLYKVSKMTAFRDLQQLVREGLIRERGKYRDKRYIAK